MAQCIFLHLNVLSFLRALFSTLVFFALTICEVSAQQGVPALYTAIQSQDLAATRAALVAGADVNAVWDEDTMLCWAIATGEIELIKLLLKAPKINVNKYGHWYDDQSDWTRTPLILAAHMGQAEVVQLLLDKGADINARGIENGGSKNTGNTALMKATYRNHVDTVRVLLTNKKCDVNLRDKDGKSALWLAVNRENINTLTLIMAAGAKVNQPDAQGRSILTEAIQNNKTEVLDFLVASGADLNVADRFGATTLITIMSSRKDDKPRIAFLAAFLKHKPNLDFVSKKGTECGYSALHAATSFGAVEYMAMLLDAGARTNVKSSNTGGTPLHTAASWKFPEATRLLIERNADLEALDDRGFTPLVVAASTYKIKNVKLLVDAGAQVNCTTTSQDLTPLIATVNNIDPFNHNDSLACMRYLLEHSAEADFAPASGRTALMVASALSDHGQSFDKVKLLLENGAKVNAVDGHNRTALTFATLVNNSKVVKLLLDKGADPTIKSDAEIALAKPATINKDLVGVWRGFQDGMPMAQFNLVLIKDGSFTFESRFTDEYLKQFAKGSIQPVIATQKGMWTVDGAVLVLVIKDAAPLSRRWKFDKKMLILDDIIRLNRIK